MKYTDDELELRDRITGCLGAWKEDGDDAVTGQLYKDLIGLVPHFCDVGLANAISAIMQFASALICRVAGTNGYGPDVIEVMHLAASLVLTRAGRHRVSEGQPAIH